MMERNVEPHLVGELDPFIGKAFLLSLKNLGHTELLVADEFGNYLSQGSNKGLKIEHMLPICGMAVRLLKTRV